MTNMNKAEFKSRVGQLIRQYRRQLLISNSWKIQYELRPSKDYAEVQYHYDKREFVIYVNKSLNLKEKELRDTIIHELFHIFLSPYTDIAGKILDANRDGKVLKYSKTLKKLQATEERLVRKLTKIILNLEIDYGKK